MARRKSKKTRRRKTQKKVNLIGVAESVIIANVVTEGLFNTDLKHFLTGRLGAAAYGPSNKDNIITLPEILGIDGTGQAINMQTFSVPFSPVGTMQVIKDNLKTNAMDMTFKLVTIPIAFKVVTKLTAAPRRQANKLLNYTNVGVKV